MKKEKRLTDNIYGENPIHVGAERTTAIYEKCYALEDIMEKYDIKDLEELDKIIGQWKATVGALEFIKEYFVLKNEYGEVSLEQKKIFSENKLKELEEILK